MTTYDPALCERLVKYARRFMPADISKENLTAMADQLEAARLRISSADAELDSANADLSTLRGLRASAQAEVERLSGCSKSWASHAASIIAERDSLRESVHVLTAATRADQLRVELACEERDSLEKERDALRAEVEKMRPVVDAADAWRDAIDDTDGPADGDGILGAAVALSDAVDAYRSKP